MCWQSCPAGTRDDGTCCWVDYTSFTKTSYIVAPSIPSYCPAGWSSDGLGTCFQDCSAFPNTPTNGGLLCLSVCPSGYTDTGLLCTQGVDIFFKDQYLPAPVVLSPGTCARVGKEMLGLLCYTPCRAGYQGDVFSCWDPSRCTGDGYKVEGVYCVREVSIPAKQTYGRGVGYIGICDSGYSLEAGLCYHPCPANTYGIAVSLSRSSSFDCQVGIRGFEPLTQTGVASVSSMSIGALQVPVPVHLCQLMTVIQWPLPLLPCTDDMLGDMSECFVNGYRRHVL